MAAKPQPIQMTKALPAAASKELVRAVTSVRISDQRRRTLVAYGDAARQAFARPLPATTLKK